MLGLLEAIVCVLRNILLAVAYAGVELVNLLVAAVAALAAFVLGLLPAMPEVPQLPAAAADAAGWLAWVFPVEPALAVFGGLLTTYLVFLGIRIALKWVKAL